MNENEVVSLIKCIEQLEFISFEERTDVYNKVIFLNQIQLYENCEHEYIQDFIDVSNDKTMLITYCSKSNLYFDINFYFEYFKYSLSNINKDHWKVKIRAHTCPLINFQLKDNKIQFIVFKNEIEKVTVNAFLKDLLDSKVCNNTIVIKNMNSNNFIN
tara:strand:+ start:35981 stop:36454 length:474 start_codon:yes stop_codon:yes gene_type:complete